MSIQGMTATPTDIALTGMKAEASRLRCIATNIANAQNTRTTAGGAFRRHEVLLSSSNDVLGGVMVDGVAEDSATPMQSKWAPWHPHADARGFVQYPNVQVAQEMMDMIVASRAYQANAAVLKRQGDINNTALELLR